ncbi:NUDIX domain-containing protein [Candidatus Woesebacteria bacterium]|nr:NUDIX domain-containing protein [Candidatus Woesebacteria bacterium]
MLQKNVKLLQKAVLIHDGKFLILQRNEKAKSRPLCWDLPGGNSEWPENVTENLENLHQKDVAREILEETGITVLDEHFTFENMVLFRTFFEAESEVYSIITGWKVELPDDFERSLVQLSDEHINHEWVTFDELNEYDFGNKKGEFIKDVIRAVI